MVTVDGNRAEFSFFRPKAHSVHLIGEFNGWQEGDLSMTCDRGYWRAGIRLPVGEYRFHYVADGQHFVDYAAFGIEPGPFGFNSVVRIASPSPRDLVFGSCQYGSTKMIQDMDARRTQVIHRLKEFGFHPQTIDQILLMIDAVMTGGAPQADMLVGAKEVYKECDLSSTHQHVPTLLTCAAGEVIKYQSPSLDTHSDAPRRTRSGSACWNDKRRGRVGRVPA
jgi:hypothetical protein